MPAKMKLLLLVVILVIVMLYTEAAAIIEPSTAEPESSVAYVSVEGNHHDTGGEPDTAVEEDGHNEEEERHETGGSDEKEHEHQESDKHEEQQHSHHWNYHGQNGPESWSSMHKECEGRYQSPINIDIESTKLNEHLTEISFLVHNATGDRMTISNNGHSVNFAYDRTTLRLDGGSYDHTYRVAGVHFHWGSDDQEGSEHMIQGKHFPLEMHVVSYDEDDFNSVGEATASRDGIAVLGILFTVSENDNVYLDPLISHLKDVRDPDDLVSLEYINLEKLLPLNRRNYFRYSGSLTTPPCSESVIWTVFESPQTISSKQLAEFRTLHETAHSKGTDDRLLHNWRPVQPTLTRVVYRSFPSLTAVSHLSPVGAAKNSRIDDHEPYNAATSPVTMCQRNIFIGWMTFYLIATRL